MKEAGKQAVSRNQYADAITHFGHANELRQDKCSECLVWLAPIEMTEGKMEEASAHVGKAAAVALDKAQLATAQLYRGVVFSRQGELRQAESAFKAASAANPACLECRFNLGFVLQAIERCRRRSRAQDRGTRFCRYSERARGSKVHCRSWPHSQKLRSGVFGELGTSAIKILLMNYYR